jgi:hypothetical protein
LSIPERTVLFPFEATMPARSITIERMPFSVPIGLCAEFTAEIEREFAELISGIQVAKMEAF